MARNWIILLAGMVAVLYMSSLRRAEARAVTIGAAASGCCTISGCGCVFAEDGNSVDQSKWLIPNEWIDDYLWTDAGTQCASAAQVSASSGTLLLNNVTNTRAACPTDWDAGIKGGGTVPGPTYYDVSLMQSRTFQFAYGTVEARFQSSAIANGIWPAFWTIGGVCHSTTVGVFGQTQISHYSGGGCTYLAAGVGEIDIAEFDGKGFAGYPTTQITQGLHALGDDVVAFVGASPDPATVFHTYSVQWSPGSLLYFIDGTQTSSVINAAVPNYPEFLLLSNFVMTPEASGGTWPLVDAGTLPTQLKVDYLYVTQDPAQCQVGASWVCSHT